MFQRYKVKRAGNKRRLLIIDSHFSYINMKFINLYDSLNILLLILFLHITYRF